MKLPIVGVILVTSLAFNTPSAETNPDFFVREETNPRMCTLKGDIKISCAYLMALVNQVKSESTASSIQEKRPEFRKDI